LQINDFAAQATAPAAIPIGTWTHYEGVYQPSQYVRFYVNGVLVDEDTSSVPASLNDTGDVLAVGDRQNGCGCYFPGLIDDVRIYNYARTPAQVAWDYNNGKPIAHWKLDECSGTTAYDSVATPSGKRNDGTITIGASGSQTSAGNCATTDTSAAWYNGRDGKYNASLNFDGTDDYVQMADNNIFDFGTGDFTIAAWINQNAGGNPLPAVVSHYDFSTGPIMYAGYDSGNPDALACEPNNPQLARGTTNLRGTGWHHIACIRSAGVMYAYVDGKLEGQGNNTANVASTNPVNIGKSSHVSGEEFSGQIDDVRVYNYALTATQIRTVYNEDAAVRFGPLTGSP
jgi:hypothetical protein